MKKTAANKQDKKVRFDYDMTWYLLPPNGQKEKQEFFGLLHEGRKLQDKSAFRKRKEGRNDSRIRIASFNNIFRWFSEPFVYPVKIDKGSHVEQSDDGYFWFASRVTVMASQNCWDLFADFGINFIGNINLDGQPYIPERLVFPTVLRGDLTFSHSELPSKIRLPMAIEGELLIQGCNIPPTWKLPMQIDCLHLIGSSFYSNFDFKIIKLTELHIVNCMHAHRLKWPRVFPGRLTISGEKISGPDFFPEEVTDLFVNESSFEKNALLPKIIHDTLSFVDVEFGPNVGMPQKCKVLTALATRFPVDFSFPAGLQRIELILCTLHENFRMPGSKPIQLIFNEMDIPASLKFPIQFKGTLKFLYCTIQGGLQLPEAIVGELLLGHCTMNDALKIPVNKGCRVTMYEDDQIDKLIAPEPILKKIRFEKDPQSVDDNDLPF